MTEAWPAPQRAHCNHRPRYRLANAARARASRRRPPRAAAGHHRSINRGRSRDAVLHVRDLGRSWSMRACVLVWRCTRGVGSSTAPRRWARSVPHSGGARVRHSSAVCGAPELLERPAQQDDNRQCAQRRASHRRTEVSRCEYSEYPCAQHTDHTHCPQAYKPHRHATKAAAVCGTDRHKRAHSHTKQASARWLQTMGGVRPSPRADVAAVRPSPGSSSSLQPVSRRWRSNPIRCSSQAH